MKKIFLSILFLFIALSFSTKVQAAGSTLNFECLNTPDDHCELKGTNPLFSKGNDGVWYPGRTVTKTISLKNSTSDPSQMNIRGNRTLGTNILENVLSISLTPAGSGPVLWSGTLSQFYNAGYIGLGSFSSGASLDYYLTVSFDPSADNDYQGLSSTFDLDLNFSQSAPSSNGEGSGGEGGAVLGTGVSAPSCNDDKPRSAPVLISAATSGANQVTLTWTAANSPVTYYLVAYGTSPGTLQYGNPNVGGSGTTSYIVSVLSGGTTYYFKVRAGNGCTPGDYSNELSVTPSGTVISGIASGFAEGILGAETEEGREDNISITPSPMPNKEVLGKEESSTVETQSKMNQSLFNTRYLFLFVISLIIIISLRFWLKKRSED